jgi:uncharacterized protein YjbI with pentapeptide repeats
MTHMDFKKFLRQNVKSVGMAIGVGGVFVGLWWFQQVNVNALGKKINLLEQKIGRMSSVDEQVKLEKDILVVEKDKTTLQNGVYTTLVQAAGGLILSLTAYVGYCNFKVGEKNLKVTEDKQVTERFSKGIEHLGSDKIDIRLGGIYALEQIANDSSKYHWTIVEILSAFVRERCPIEKVAPESEVQLDPNNKDSESTIKKVKADVQAALTVMGRRKLEQDPEGKRIDLREVNISGADLNEAKLIGAYLIDANLNGAYLIRANLSGADLSSAYLSGANFSDAYLSGANLSDANLCDANLSGANLGGADLSRANLIEANFRDATLSRADLSNANFFGANLIDAYFRGADLRHANLMRCKDLTREQIDSAHTDENTLLPDHLLPSYLKIRH